MYKCVNVVFMQFIVQSALLFILDFILYSTCNYDISIFILFVVYVSRQHTCLNQDYF